MEKVDNDKLNAESIKALMSMCEKINTNVEAMRRAVNVLIAMQHNNVSATSTQPISVAEPQKEVVVTVSEVVPEQTEPVSQPSEPVSQPEMSVPPTFEISEALPEVTEPQPEIVESQPQVTEPQLEVTEPQPEVTEPQPEVAEPQPEVAEPQPKPAEPKPVEKIKKSPAKSQAEAATNAEKNIGIRWMAISGIFIAVLGLALCIKYMLDKGLLGPVAIVSMGYVAAAVMTFFSFKVSEQHKVLKDTLIIGGSTLGYAVTSVAYGFYDMIPSYAALAITLAISLGLSFFSFVKNKWIMYNYAFLGLVLAPLCSGIPWYRSSNQCFWMPFTVVINILHLYLYKVKTWVSTYILSFIITVFNELFIIKYGVDYSLYIYLGYFALLLVLFYAGIVILSLNNKSENFKNSSSEYFGFFSIISILVFLLMVVLKFENRHLIAPIFVATSVALALTGVLFRIYKTEVKAFFTVPYFVGLLLLNVSFFVYDFVKPHVHWLPFLFSIDILAFVFLYRCLYGKGYKSFAATLTYIGVVMIFIIIPLYNIISYQHYGKYTLIFNPFFLGQLVFICVMVYLYIVKIIPRKPFTSFVVVACMFVSFVSEDYNYWHYVNVYYSGNALECVSSLSIMLFGCFGFSLILSNLPKRLSWTKDFIILGKASLLISIIYFCVSGIYHLNMLRGCFDPVPGTYHLWRYGSLAVAALVIFFIIKFRNSKLIDYFDTFSDIIASGAIIWIVAAEIHNLFQLYDFNIKQYRAFVTLWFTVSSLLLFVLGLKYKIKHLRVLGFVMAGITVLKLFFVDIWNSELIVKAAVFVAIGLVFLLISYIYSKYFKNHNQSDQQGKLEEEKHDDIVTP